MTDTQMEPAPTTTMPATVLTRQCEAEPEFNYILLTVEMELLASSTTTTNSTATATSDMATRLQGYNLPILTFRKMLSSALQDLFGIAVGGGMSIDILAYATPQDLQTAQQQQTNDRSSSTFTSTSSAHSLFSTLASSSSSPSSTSSSSRTTAYAILRCATQDLHPLWSALTLFNATVDDLDVRIHVHHSSATLLALASSSRSYSWDKAPSFPTST
ncbi:hypothetical protein DFQ26_001237 [Actinomortierella ambigua]|nr:hypothetical protein DFQ26_001237 [Actinomortierella ambigua]